MVKIVKRIGLLILISVISFILCSSLIQGIAPRVQINNYSGLDCPEILFLITLLIFWVYNIVLLVKKATIKKIIFPSVALLLFPVIWWIILIALSYFAGPRNSVQGANIIIALDGSTNKIVHWDKE